MGPAPTYVGENLRRGLDIARAQVRSALQLRCDGSTTTAEVLDPK